MEVKKYKIHEILCSLQFANNSLILPTSWWTTSYKCGWLKCSFFWGHEWQCLRTKPHFEQSCGQLYICTILMLMMLWKFWMQVPFYMDYWHGHLVSEKWSDPWEYSLRHSIVQGHFQERVRCGYPSCKTEIQTTDWWMANSMFVPFMIFFTSFFLFLIRTLVRIFLCFFNISI